MTASVYIDLHRALHRIADAAIAADDALLGRDHDALRRAIDTLSANVDMTRTLADQIIGRSA